jgi:hypothetical protein
MLVLGTLFKLSTETGGNVPPRQHAVGQREREVEVMAAGVTLIPRTRLKLKCIGVLCVGLID